MPDIADRPYDDAPLSASKDSDAAVRIATHEAIEDRGDSLTGWAVTINRPAADLYAWWRDFSNLADVMENVDRVDVIDDRRSHWVVKAPGGTLVEWDALVTEEEEGRLIAWASAEGADIANSGRVTFRDAGARGTVVTATILYDPPAGVIGKLVAKLFQREPNIQVRRDLTRFKQLMETGEVATNAMNREQHEEQAA
ncbi:SRPBCC family protein [uncultured Sphingomonas sp.]|uniref:SRPBCC family protein n=1 Tax=uncultured Sphingomonas sp. TaxID=158754 RepID=UPI0025D8FF2C|nr:SRPBCC family protein [uncultured Sphingomonas sp.]